MSETILRIIDTDEGYRVVTDKQDIELYISMDQCCCENTGYFMSEEDLEPFIGAELTDVIIVDTALHSHQDVDVYEGGIMFVNLETNRGTLQFVAYNSHNGYYGHKAKVTSNQITQEEYL